MIDLFDIFVANLFKARKTIENLAIAIKEYNLNEPEFSYVFEFPYPKGEINKLLFNRAYMERYMRFSREIPDNVVANNLQEFKENVEYTLQNIFIILLKYYKELAYLYKAKDLAQQKIHLNINIEYTFKNPFHPFIQFTEETRKYTGTSLIYLDSLQHSEFIDIFNLQGLFQEQYQVQVKKDVNGLKDIEMSDGDDADNDADNDADDDTDNDVDDKSEANIQMVITKIF